MDATSMVIGVLISLVVCTILVLAVKVSFREREYDEVFGRQEPAAVSSAGKKAIKKKKAKSKGGVSSDATTDEEGKGANGRDRDTGDSMQASSDDRRPHVEYDPDPVVIDEPMPANKAKPEHIPKKSILRNRTDSTKDSEVPVESEKSQRSSFSRIPKDEVELKHHPELKSRHSAKAAQSVSGNERKASSSSTSSSEALASDEVLEIAQRAVTYEAPPPQQLQQLPQDVGSTPASAAAAIESKPPGLAAAETTKKIKAKATTAAASRQPTATAPRVEDVHSIAAAVQKASLSKADVQVLIDALLGKDESSSPSWTTKSQKGDPVAQLTKQLEDKDRQLQEERQQAAAAAAQLSRQGKELQEERARRAQGERQASERTASLGAELAALRQRMQQSHEQHVTDVAKLRQQSADAQEAAVSRLSQEYQQLKQAMPHASEMKALREQAEIVKNELANSIQSLTSAEQKCRHLEEQIAAKDLMLGKQLDDLKQQAAQMKVMASEAEQAIQAKQDAELRAGQLQSDLHQIMASLDLTVKEKDKEMQMLKHQLNVMDSKHRQMQSSGQAAAELEDYKARLSQSHAEVGRLQARLDEAMLRPASSAALKETIAQHVDTSAVDVEQQQRHAATLEAEVEALQQAKQQLGEQQRQTEARLQAELSDARRRNDELRRKNWLLAEAVESAEKLASQTPDLKRQLDSSGATLEALTSQVKHLEERNAHLTTEASRQNAGAAAFETQAAAELGELRQQLRSREFEIDSLQADLEVQRQTADAFKVKYDKAEKVDHSSSGSTAATADVLQQLKACQKELAQLKEQLSAQAVSTAPLEQVRKSGSRQSETSEASLAADGDLRRQLEAQKAKNNELREKNWKLAEALNEAQKHRGSSTPAAATAATIPVAPVALPTDAGFSQVKQTLSRLYPNVHLDANLTASAWLSQFEAAVREHEQKDLATSTSHKSLLVQTDRALAAVQSRLEAEEAKWQQTVAAKDAELVHLRDQLQKQAKAVA